MRIAVLADTHIPKRAKDLPLSAYRLIDGADAIIHAGDVLTNDFLTRLRAIAPVYAVRGNNDLEIDLPERLELTLAGVNIAVVHDSGDRKGRAKRLRKWFPQAAIAIFGHSHICMNEAQDGLLLFNPGSPTDKRREPNFTMGILLLDAKLLSAEIVSLD